MQQRRLNAYLKLIQELLTCPRGEEWIRLKQHEDLVDADFLQVMEQVASQLLHEGNREAAVFLHNWAAKLHHILVKDTSSQPVDDRSSDYLSLIQALLECSEQEEEQLLADHRDLIGPGLVDKMRQVAEQLKQQGSVQSASYLQNLATELNQTWVEAHAFQPCLKKEDARRLENPHDTAADHSQAVLTEPSLATPQLNQQLAAAISEMSQALHQLTQTLTTQTTNPLWYMDALERAATANWLLTTEEIEQLIGVKPKCHGKQTTYQRGTWTFVKAGKLGAQTAWRVVKTPLEPLDITTVESPDSDRKAALDLGNSVKLNQSPEQQLQHPANSGPWGSNKQTNSWEVPELEDVWA